MNQKPTQRQIKYIEQLAKTAGLKVDTNKITSQKQASGLIDRLKNGHDPINDIRDKKIAYGMATKLVYGKYLHLDIDCMKSNDFWNEVEELYRQYQKKQTDVLHSPTNRV